MSITTKLLAFLATLILAMSAQAGYLDTSPNWKAPETIPLSRKKALAAAESCKTVNYYAYKVKGNSGAMVVAGAHPTEEDPRVHLTVRLYRNNHHEKTCHVYIDNTGRYSGCQCWDV